jgi:hypothetical protein
MAYVRHARRTVVSFVVPLARVRSNTSFERTREG